MDACFFEGKANEKRCKIAQLNLEYGLSQDESGFLEQTETF
jgi:hypothetical protein